MPDKTPLKPYADLKVVTGKYLKGGKEKNRYEKVGVLLASPHLSHMSIHMPVIPRQEWIKVFVRDDWKEPDDNTETEEPMGNTPF